MGQGAQQAFREVDQRLGFLTREVKKGVGGTLDAMFNPPPEIQEANPPITERARRTGAPP